MYTPVILVVILILTSVFLVQLRSNQLKPIQSGTEITCIPTFKDGGGPYYLDNAPFRNNLVPKMHNGEKLVVTGKVLSNDCVTPLAEVVVDIWQANESGEYQDEWYRGRVTTSKMGEYQFETVIPKGYGEGTAFRPPHIHFKIWQNGRELVTSQMFLPVSRAQGIEDSYIMTLETREDNGIKTHQGFHNIIVP